MCVYIHTHTQGYVAAHTHTLGYGMDGPEVESLYGQEILLCSKLYRPAVGPTQPPIQWVLDISRG